VNQTHGFVPFGLGNSGLWDGSTEVGNGKLFSGTAGGWGADVKTLTDDRSTHAYWNKDDADSTGGKVKLDSDRLPALTASDPTKAGSENKCFWQATTFDKVSGGKFSANGASAGYGDYINDTGEAPKAGSKERVYVCKKIENQYDLAMKLAIDQTVQEIQKFYGDAAKVMIGEGADAKPLTYFLNMDSIALYVNNIQYWSFPDKENGYVKK